MIDVEITYLIKSQTYLLGNKNILRICFKYILI